MQSKLFAIVAGSTLLVASLGAEAMPLGPVAGSASGAAIQPVAEGCGPGFEVGPAGGCRRIRGGGAVVVEKRVVRPARPRCGVRVPGVAIITPC